MSSDVPLPKAFSLQEPIDRPPCGKLQPFAKDERIWWAFTCAAERSLKQMPNPAATQLVERLQTWSLIDAHTFVQAYQRGSVAGGIEALERYYDDLISLVRS